MTASVRAAGAFSKSCSRIDRVRFPVPAYKTTLGLQSYFLRTAVLRARYRSCSNAGRQGRRSHEREALLASDSPFHKDDRCQSATALGIVDISPVVVYYLGIAA